MKWLRRILGTDFPDPQAGQVWRSKHSGRAFLVVSAERSDCGRMWHVSEQVEAREGEFTMIPMSRCMFPFQWRRMLREEGRVLQTPEFERCVEVIAKGIASLPLKITQK